MMSIPGDHMLEGSLTSCFASLFTDARSLFIEATKNVGASVTSFTNENAVGPSGEPLLTDVAWLGDPAASRVLVLVSGTHGVEGFAGSGLQVAQMRAGQFAAVPCNIAVMFVHALNPYGLAWGRRVNEDNVDLNRNFIDFPGPDNPSYCALHSLLTSSPHGVGKHYRKARLLSRKLTGRMRSTQDAVTRGQYTHHDGLFYGGQKPTWSRHMFDHILERLRDRQRVTLIDYHTGLGPRGHGTLISRRGAALPPWLSHCWRRVALPSSSWNDEVELVDKNSVSSDVRGDLITYTMQAGYNFAAVALEFGTLPPLNVLDALIDENWAHIHKDPDRDVFRAALRGAFCPDDEIWYAAIVKRAASVTEKALRGLQA